MGNSMIDLIVPSTAHIACPDRFFRVRPVSACLSCGAFKGFTQVQEQGDGEAEVLFEVMYRVQCNHPINRRMTLVEAD